MTAVARADLKPLTSLRFVAALLVFSYHCVTTRAISGAFLLGPAGLSFFFLLSGFILTHMYSEDFKTLSFERVRSFYVARIARIYPLHIVGVALGATVFGVSTGALLAQILLVQAWMSDPAIYRSVNPVSWSISVEASFYILFPLIAFGMLRFFGKAPEKSVLLAALGLWCIQAVTLAPQTAAIDEWRFYVFPPARLVDFVLGMLLGTAFARRDIPNRLSRRGLHPTSVEMLVVASAVLAIYVAPILPMADRISASSMPFFGALIYVFARQQGALSHVLSLPVMVRLGEASFAFYLIHLTIISLFARALGWDSGLLALAASVGAALAMHAWVETPMRRLIRQKFSQPASGALTPSESPASF